MLGQTVFMSDGDGSGRNQARGSGALARPERLADLDGRAARGLARFFGGRAGLALAVVVAMVGGISLRVASGFQGAPTLAEPGTWELRIDGAGGGGFKAPVTFYRRPGGRVVGVMEWRSDGPLKTLELFSATIDPSSGDLRFDGRIKYSKVDGQFPTTYVGKLAADGRTLTGFRSTGPGTTDAVGTMKWVKAEVPTYPPSIAASLNLVDERSLLYQQLSAHYVLEGTPVRLGPDRPLLEELSRSRDKHVRSLAELRVSLQDYCDQARSKDAIEAQAWAKDDVERRSKILRFTAESLSKDDSSGQLKLCADLLNSVGLKKGFDRRRAQIEMACVQVAVINRVRAEIHEACQAGNQGKKTLGAGKLTAGFKVNDEGRGVLTLVNKTGGDLHGVFVDSRMTVDPAKVDRDERENQGKERVAGMISVALGIDPGIIDSINNLEEILYGYSRIDKGASTFVPLWPKNAVLEVELAMPNDIQSYASSVGAWVASDEGVTPISLNLDTVKRLIPDPAQKKGRTPKKKR